MATNRQVVCDECGQVIVLVKPGENETEAVVLTGGISAGISPTGKDLCLRHTRRSSESREAVRSYIVRT